MNHRRQHKLAPVGTQERAWQDAIRKSYKLVKKFSDKKSSKKRMKSGGANLGKHTHKRRQQKKLSKLERRKRDRNMSAQRAQSSIIDTIGSDMLSVGKMKYKNNSQPTMTHTHVTPASSIYSNTLAELQQDLYGD